MPSFHYRALDDRGRKKKGFLEADSESSAYTLLQDQGLVPLVIEAARGKSGKDGPNLAARLKELAPAKSQQVGEAFYYLALLLRTGSSLTEALDLLGRMAGGGRGKVWLSIRDSVESGESFSQALARHPKQFEQVYIGMVQVAEEVGRLSEVLEKIAENEEQQSEVRGKLLTALIYPLVIAFVGAGAVYFLLANVLPKLARIFETSKQALPPQTEFLLWVSSWLSDFGALALIPPLAVILGCIMAYRSNEALQLKVDALMWRVGLVQKYTLARFSGMLGFQLESGIPLVQALQNCSGAIGSSHFRAILKDVTVKVSEGKPLDKMLQATGEFPDIYILTLSMGQQAGKLGTFLLRLNRLLERDVENILKRLMALVEPLLILVVGLVIAFIVLAIMEPIFSLSTLVR